MSEEDWKQLPLIARSNFWLEIDGVVVLSQWRVRLLKTIAQTGSISAAARHLEIPYRLAWQRVHEMEERLHTPLLASKRGGHGGGGSALTPVAEELIRRYERFAKGLDEVVNSHFHDAF